MEIKQQKYTLVLRVPITLAGYGEVDKAFRPKEIAAHFTLDEWEDGRHPFYKELVQEGIEQVVKEAATQAVYIALCKKNDSAHAACQKWFQESRLTVFADVCSWHCMLAEKS